MPPLKKLNYLNGVVICHGKSELCIAKFITTNLHLRIKVFAKEKGGSSIQIPGLMKVLNTKPFDKPTSFIEQYSDVEFSGRGKKTKLSNFKLFIIMDTDDCTDKQKEDFISGAMFAEHWLSEYIVPIYSIKSVEDVMIDVGLMKERIPDNEKGKFYTKVFPINPKPLSNDTLQEVKTLREKVEKSRKTNLIAFIDYCLKLLPAK